MLEVERLSIETPSPTSGDHLKVNMQFRSLLLHEPIPKEGAGYIHLQGAFEPKQKKKKEADAAPDPAHQYYWTDSNLLERALMEVLSLRYQSINLPYPVQSIEVLDPTPPFTRIRLTYPSPLHALKTQMAWRSRNISPSQLFPSQDNALFGSRACQASAITTAPLPLQSWERSSPPKFRRFLHDHNDSEERSKTRFVFVTGLLEGANNNEQYTTTFWNNQFDAQESIRRTFNLFDSTGVGVEVFLSKKQQLAQTCHVGMRSPKDAQRVVKELQDRVVTWESNGERISSGSLFLDYTAVTQKSIAKSKARAAGQELEKGEVSRPECTSTTESVQIPGLVSVCWQVLRFKLDRVQWSF